VAWSRGLSHATNLKTCCEFCFLWSRRKSFAPIQRLSVWHISRWVNFFLATAGLSLREKNLQQIMIRNEIKLNFSGDKFERTSQNLPQQSRDDWFCYFQVRIVTIWMLEAIKKNLLRQDSHTITEEIDHQKGQTVNTIARTYLSSSMTDGNWAKWLLNIYQLLFICGLT